jgi:hypothetical protein
VTAFFPDDSADNIFQKKMRKFAVFSGLKVRNAVFKTIKAGIPEPPLKY